MPIYEYRCKDCGKVSEFQMKMSDPNPEACPSCGHAALSKIMSLPSFQLKGGGWYSDAYDGKSNKSTSAPADTSGTTDGKSAAAPGATPPSSPAAAAPAPASPSTSAPSTAAASTSPSVSASGSRSGSNSGG